MSWQWVFAGPLVAGISRKKETRTFAASRASGFCGGTDTFHAKELYVQTSVVQDTGRKAIWKTEDAGKVEFPSFGGIDAADLQAFVGQSVEWLVSDVFSDDEPLIIGAARKSCKTLLLFDLACAVATGTDWLKTFHVPRKRRVLFVTGETNYRRTAVHVQKCLASRAMTWDDVAGWLRVEAKDFPSFTKSLDLEGIRRTVAEHGAEVVILDPLFRGMQSVDASKLFEVGPVLKELQAAVSPALMILSHHFVKPLKHFKAMEPGSGDVPLPSLDDLTGAGIAESCGQWWLQTRTERYQYDDRHSLIVEYGGREGQSGALQIAFDERCWQFDVRSASEFRQAAVQLKQEQQSRQAEEQREIDRCAVMRAMRNCKEPMSKEAVKTRAGLKGSRGRFDDALAELVVDQSVSLRRYQDVCGRWQKSGFILSEYVAEYDAAVRAKSESDSQSEAVVDLESEPVASRKKTGKMPTKKSRTKPAQKRRQAKAEKDVC